MQVLNDITIHVDSGEVVTVLGRNGAGKTTLLRSLLKQAHIYSGSILLEGRPLNDLSIKDLVSLGITYVPQEKKVFARCTVRENLLFGLHQKTGQRQQEEALEEILEQFPMLGERLAQEAGLMSGGEQQQLSIARALMSKPRILLLDEPSIGLSPKILGEILGKIQSLKQQYNLTILLTEQNVSRALEIADRAYVLDLGTVVQAREAEEMRNDPDIRNIYFQTAVR